MTRVLVLHPGQMGAAVGRALRAGGSEVGWVPEGRGRASRARAEEGGFTGLAAIAEAVDWADVVFSVCPPAAADKVAGDVAGAGFTGLYVDANAVAPGTARRVAATVEAAGASFVDGGIVGPPPERPGTTRLYLSGGQAADVAAMLAGSALEPVVVAGGPGAASGVKAAYAAWTKASGALLLAARALARVEGVEDVLVAEWARSQPGVAAWSEGAAEGTAPKAWRFAGEMEEQAAAFAAQGLPEGFSLAAAEVYRRLEEFKDAAPAPSLDEVLDALTRAQPER